MDSYQTKLLPQQENQFNQWATKNQNRIGPANVVNDPLSDYDYRGWWKENSGVDAPDGHFTDKYKTPYHESFSNESQYAIPDKAPAWKQQGKSYQLTSPDGEILYKE